MIKNSRWPIALAVLGAVALAVGIRWLPTDRVVSSDFTRTGGVPFGAERCVLFQISGTARSRASVTLGPFTRWSHVQVVESKVVATVHTATEPNGCHSSDPASTLTSFRLTQRWDGAEEPRFALFDGDFHGVSAGPANQYTQALGAGPIDLQVNSRGRRLCLHVVIEADRSGDGPTARLPIVTCLPGSSS